MPQKTDNGCVVVVIAGLLLLAIGKCSGSTEIPADPAQSGQPLYDPAASENMTPAATLYIATRRLNYRAADNRQADIVSRLAHGDQVTTSRNSGD